MEILLKNIPPDGNSCMLYECECCDLQGISSCEEIADFLGKKKRISQKNTKGIEALERQIKRLEERIEVLEKIPMPATQSYSWTPIEPTYRGDTPETINMSDATAGKCNHDDTFVYHVSSVPSDKISIPFEKPLVFCVTAGKIFNGRKPGSKPEIPKGIPNGCYRGF